MATMKLSNVNKIYPNGVQAVFDFNIDVKEGEFIVLVGPSGCGKSTTLRMIAGLEEITSGEMYIGDRLVNDEAPKDRDIAMVFQNYALYAHMTVYHNMAFSLVLRKEDSDYIHKRVMWAAEILGLTEYLNRKPANLSGGQRQRVALGRAIVRDPQIFLLDEPLSNLDAKLRGELRKELKSLHHALQTTMVYVTHDQIEALTLADRIVIMKDGYIDQIGTPVEVYTNPATLFVAEFIGTPPMNAYNVSLTENGEIKLTNKDTIDLKGTKVYESLKPFFGKEVVMGVRPEHFIIDKALSGKGLSIEVENYELLGSEALVHFTLPGANLRNKKTSIAKINARVQLAVGEPAKVAIDVNKIYFFNPETGGRIYGTEV